MTHIFTASLGTRAVLALVLLLTAALAAGCEITVMEPGERAVSSVHVLPLERTLVVGEHDRPVPWTTDFPAVATVSQAGLMTGTGHGYVTITATSEGRSFSIGANVTNDEVDDMPLDLVYRGGGYSPQWITRP